MRVLKVAYLNITFYLLFIIFSIIAVSNLSLLVIISALIFPRRKAMKILRRAISWYGAVIIRILPFPLVRLSFKNFSKGNKDKGPFIFICNHRSASDPFLIGALPYEIIQVANIWPFRLPVLGLVARIAGYLSVRQLPFEEFLFKSRKLLSEGVSIVAFPEGTRSRDNSVGQFHSAIFRVALESRLAIVPLCITGNENIPPVGSPYLRPGLIKMHMLPSIKWEEYRYFNAFKLKNYVRDIIVKEVALMDREK
jgi:1-acyl-sn-glycerol-3-phosphate acyltransferase